MDAISAAIPGRGNGFLDWLLPLKPWLGPDSSLDIEQGQARTRLICALIGLCGFVVIRRFASLPDGIVATAVLFPLYAIGYAIHVRVHPAPTRARRAVAVLTDNLALGFIVSFGDAFAAYIAFYFLSTVGWGLRFGRHYLFMTTAVAILGMVCNMVASRYWQQNEIFGAVIIIAMIANTINVAVLLRTIAWGNRRLAEKIDEVSQLAWQDQLTDLPNRLYFHERLSQTLALAERNGRQVALLLFDIDGFKSVNDTLGHEAGDRLLQEIAERVGRQLRQADTFARLGGDEFVVLMEIIRDRSDAAHVAETIINAAGEIDIFADRGLRIGVSVGIACSEPAAARERISDELLNQADRAMYAAKRAGKGCYRFADET
ncbi:MAG: GGDEF domain-containing protein [Burkholderiales bacterium]